MQNLRVLAGARGRPWRVDRIDTFDRRTRVAFAHLASGSGALVAIRPFEPVSRIDAPADLRPVPVRAAVAAVERALSSRRTAFTLRAAERLRGDIHPWQLAAALAFERGHARVLVSDEAGMGKTISAGVALAQCLDAAADHRCLVIAPGHLLRQWQTELAHRLSLDTRAIDASTLRRLQGEIPAGVAPWMLPGCFMTSIDFVKQPHVRMSLTSIAWDLLVIDEAHLACGDSERHAAAQMIAMRSRALLLLTATPSDGGGDRFRALVSLGAAEPLVHLRHAAAWHNRVDRRLRIAAPAATMELHDALLDYTEWIGRGPLRDVPAVALLCSLLTKRALSSAHALLLSLERRLALIRLDPQPMQPSLFELDDDPGVIGAATGMPAALESARLQQLARAAGRAARDDRKLRTVLRLIERTREPVVIFTCFRDTALLLERRLRPLAPVRIVHGELPPATNEAALRAFTEGPARVLVATDVASQGLNLHQRCRWVVHYDLPWRPPTIRQRTGRVDRLGQSRRAHATFLVAGTPLASAADDRLAGLTSQMQAEERATGTRWDILAAAEASRLGTVRSPACGGAARTAYPEAVTVIETEFVDAAGNTIERSVEGFAACEADAKDRAGDVAARRRAQLARRLRTRARRRMAREHAVAAATLAAVMPEWRQDGLFDRRVDRLRTDADAARARLEQNSRGAIERHRREGELAAARCGVIATFRRNSSSDAR